MAVVSRDWRYQALARRAAGRLGTSSSNIIKAILAQWQCELGANDTYPPRRNNPGNVSRGWAAPLGYSFTVETPNPQPSNPIVTFATPAIGADCYADGIRKFGRYAAVRQAITRGDGEAFLRAIHAAGYGGGAGCTVPIYRGLGGTSLSTAQPPPDADLASSTSTGSKTVADYLGVSPTAIFDQAMLDQVVAKFRVKNGLRGAQFVAAQLRPRIGDRAGDIPFVTNPDGTGTPTVDLTAWVGELVAGLGEVGKKGVQAAAIAAIILIGLYLVARS